MSYLDKESLQLPKLDPAGKGWISWKSRLEIALLMRGLGPYPINPAVGESVGWKPTTPDKILAIKKFEKDSAEWIEKDAQA